MMMTKAARDYGDKVLSFEDNGAQPWLASECERPSGIPLTSSQASSKVTLHHTSLLWFKILTEIELLSSVVNNINTNEQKAPLGT